MDGQVFHYHVNALLRRIVSSQLLEEGEYVLRSLPSPQSLSTINNRWAIHLKMLSIGVNSTRTTNRY